MLPERPDDPARRPALLRPLVRLIVRHSTAAAG
ncbi:hypothetical protein ABIA38_002791 [Embleya sp. AB8]